MFGHQNSDDNAKDTSSVSGDVPVSSHEPTTIAPTAAPAAPRSSQTAANPDTGGYTMTDLPKPVPAGAPASAPAPAAAPPVSAAPVVAAPAPDLRAAGDAGDLAELKQAALHELSPLIGHLDQSPEEKFRTTMMMIQASDDQSLLPTALAAAKQIGDEKARAQALLDVVNEINYFTQQHEA